MIDCENVRPTGEKWGCCMIICHPDEPSKLLVCKRAPGERQGPETWGFVGGGVELGERPSDAVVREVSEETGLTVYHYTYLGSYRDGEYNDFVFVTDAWYGGVELDPNECTAYAWVTLEDLIAGNIAGESAPIFSFTHSTVEFYLKYLENQG